MIGYRVDRHGSGISLTLGDFSDQEGGRDYDFIVLDRIPRDGDDLFIRFYHRQHRPQDGLQLIQLKETTLFYSDRSIERWDHLPTEMWGSNQEEIGLVLKALCTGNHLMSHFRTRLQTAVNHTNGLVTV